MPPVWVTPNPPVKLYVTPYVSHYTRIAPVSATASWQDDITINSPGLTGQAGIMTITYRVNGYLIFTGTYSQTYPYKSSRLACLVQMNGLEVDAPIYELWDVGPYGPNFLNADRAIQLGFTFGTPFTIKHTLTAYTRDGLPQSCSWQGGSRGGEFVEGNYREISKHPDDEFHFHLVHRARLVATVTTAFATPYQKRADQ